MIEQRRPERNVRTAFLSASMILACSVPASSQTSQADVSDTHGATTLQVHAVGSQVYECKKTDHGSLEWAFREPVATLMAEAKTVGVHFAGPSWRMNDGSLIKGAVVKQAPGTTSSDIPWLELKTTEHAGDGALGNATGIRRVETKGGKLAGTCSPEGSFASVPYEADYVFVKP